MDAEMDKPIEEDLVRHHPLYQRNRYEFECVVDALMNYQKRDIDLVGIIVTMHRFGYISKADRVELIAKFSDLTPNLIEFVMDILQRITFEQFCFLLVFEGYRDMNTSMRQKMFSMLYRKLPKKEMAHSQRTHEYYRTIKSCIDNRKWGDDVTQKLRIFIDKQNLTIVSSNGDVTQANKEFAMERKAAALILLIQQYKDVEERKVVLNGVYSQEANGIDKTTLEIVYHSKMAMTEAQAGNVAEAEAHIQQTKILCETCGACFAVTAALHDIEYTYKVLYLNNPSDELLEKVLSEGEVALQSLQDEREDVQKLWQRILLLFMVLALLCINGDFEVGDVRKLNKSRKERAEYILKEIKRTSGKMELRRTMVMCYSLAVLNENSDNEAAVTYATKALEAARSGGTFRNVEAENIEKYLTRVSAKANRWSICSWTMFYIVLTLAFGVLCFFVAFVYSPQDLSVFTALKSMICEFLFS